MKMFAMLLLLSVPASATPYFRPIDPFHAKKVVGGYIDPLDLGASSVGGAYALITHSKNDGCFMPSVICEDWSPLMVGLSVNSGKVKLNIGPAINLTPVAKLGLLSVLNMATNSDTLSGVKSILGSQPITGPDVSTSFGPALGWTPIENGAMLPVNAWKGKFAIFAGASLSF